MAYNNEIPHSSCLSEICEKASIFAKGINASLKQDYLFPNAHDFVEIYACSSSSRDCMVGDFPQCLKPGLPLLDFKEECTMISFFQSKRVGKKIYKIMKSDLNGMKQ